MVGAKVEAHRGGEIGGLDARVGAFAFERFDETGFFAADVGACAAMKVDFEIETAAEDILAKEAFFFCLAESFFDDLSGFGEFFAKVNVSYVSSHREAGDDHAFDKLVRILMDDVTVLEGAGLGFVAVADEVDRFGVVRWNEAPLDSGGETGTTASAQTRSLDLIDDILGIHLKSLARLFVIAFFESALHGRGPVFAIDVAEDEAMLLSEGFFA